MESVDFLILHYRINVLMSRLGLISFKHFRINHEKKN